MQSKDVLSVEAPSCCSPHQQLSWIEIHQEDLLADWELAANGRKPFPIRGLDQMNIAEVVPKDNCILYIKSEDGQTGQFDVKPYLESEAFSPLEDTTEFERIHNGKYFVEWDCGTDLSADTIQARRKPKPEQNTQQGT
jgi:hypothetical protein